MPGFGGTHDDQRATQRYPSGRLWSPDRGDRSAPSPPGRRIAADRFGHRSARQIWPGARQRAERARPFDRTGFDRARSSDCQTAAPGARGDPGPRLTSGRRALFRVSRCLDAARASAHRPMPCWVRRQVCRMRSNGPIDNRCRSRLDRIHDGRVVPLPLAREAVAFATAPCRQTPGDWQGRGQVPQGKAGRRFLECCGSPKFCPPQPGARHRVAAPP